MSCRDVAKSAVALFNRIQPVKLAAVFFSAKRVEHFGNQVVDIQKLEHCRTVVHGYRQIVCGVVAKGRDRAVIVRAAPLAEKIRKTVHQNFRARLFPVCKNKVFARLLASAVLAVIAPDKGRLNGRRNHHGAFVAVFFERIQKHGRKAEITLPEFLGVFRAVNSRQVKHKIGLRAELVQLFGGVFDIVPENLFDMQIGAGSVLAVFYIIERANEVFAYKTLRARH